MKVSNLKEPYRSLAELRREQAEKTAEYLTDSFYWWPTPEGHGFWEAVYIGRHPEIPAVSLKELEEWKSNKTPNKMEICVTLQDWVKNMVKEFPQLTTKKVEELSLSEAQQIYEAYKLLKS